MSVSSPALPVTGTALEHEVRAYLRSQGFAPCYLGSTVEHVERLGTATDAPGLDPIEADAVNALIARRTGHTEYADASEWPAWTDEGRWAPTDARPVKARF